MEQQTESAVNTCMLTRRAVTIGLLASLLLAIYVVIAWAIVQATPGLPFPSASDIKIEVAAGADDADGNVFGEVDYSEPYITLSSSSRGYWRFPVNVPPWRKVDAAFLRVRAAANWSGIHTAHFKLLDDANCVDFPSDSHSRLTWGDVTWTTPAETDDNVWHTSPDIATLLQHFVDYPDYTPGNYLCLVWYPEKDSADRSVWSFDGGHGAQLVLNHRETTVTATPAWRPVASMLESTPPVTTMPRQTLVVSLTCYSYVQLQTPISILIAWRTDADRDQYSQSARCNNINRDAAWFAGGLDFEPGQ
jgi:hypothetical protein